MTKDKAMRELTVDELKSVAGGDVSWGAQYAVNQASAPFSPGMGGQPTHKPLQH